MRELVAGYLSRGITRRNFVQGLVQAGITAGAARAVAASLKTQVGAGRAAAEGVTVFEGTAGEALAEQLIASGVQYVFGNSASEDAPFYEALVDRPQLTYILTPHEGPGAAMAAGYVKASGQPAIAMEVGAVGLMNAMGQMYNAHKEQTPLVFYSYRRDTSLSSGRDGFEEVAYQEEAVAPLTKYRWMARRAERIPETVRTAFKVAWTPPYGPTYVTWHSDFNPQKVRAEIIVHDKVDPRMRIRPNPAEVERAADLLVASNQPLMIVGDELYRARAIDKAVLLAEQVGMPVVQARQVHANFPQTHPLWAGGLGRVDRLTFPSRVDLVLNVGNKLQHTGAVPMVPRGIRFIDLRIDSASMGNVMTTDVPLVADVGLGLQDLMAAVEDRSTAGFKEKVQARTMQARAFWEQAHRAQALVSRNPDWDSSPILSDRVTYEVAQFADEDAIIVDEAGSIGRGHSFQFDPLKGRELFFYYGAHLGSGVGTAAGVKLARRDRQVICLVGDGSFIFGPTALWNMARLELPVIVVVYNNHAYSGPHSRVIAKFPGGRMVQTGHFVHDYLGKPDMNMADIARGFGVDAEVAESPDQLQSALGRARLSSQEGKPYLIDARVARTGVAWAETPWTPTV